MRWWAGAIAGVVTMVMIGGSGAVFADGSDSGRSGASSAAADPTTPRE
jgi:hypothetical protein